MYAEKVKELHNDDFSFLQSEIKLADTKVIQHYILFFPFANNYYNAVNDVKPVYCVLKGKFDHNIQFLLVWCRIMANKLSLTTGRALKTDARFKAGQKMSTFTLQTQHKMIYTFFL